MKLFNICIIIASLGLGACASGGGSSGVAPVVAVAPQTSSTGSATPTDQRIAFDSWVDTYTGANGEVTVTYDMTSYTTSGLPAKTEKYFIEDYGFFRTTINGTTNRNNGTVEGTGGVESYLEEMKNIPTPCIGGGIQSCGIHRRVTMGSFQGENQILLGVFVTFF